MPVFSLMKAGKKFSLDSTPTTSPPDSPPNTTTCLKPSIVNRLNAFETGQYSLRNRGVRKPQESLSAPKHNYLRNTVCPSIHHSTNVDPMVLIVRIEPSHKDLSIVVESHGSELSGESRIRGQLQVLR